MNLITFIIRLMHILQETIYPSGNIKNHSGFIPTSQVKELSLIISETTS